MTIIIAIYRYDPRSDSWCTVSSMNFCRDAVGTAVLGGRIFAVGGYDGTSYLNSVECYDPQTQEWAVVSRKEIFFVHHLAHLKNTTFVYFCIISDGITNLNFIPL